MTAVGEWLKQIILIVLFAVMADLLLPNKDMQKYVRMVLGLAVVATMLQPLGSVVNHAWTSHLAQEAASEVTQSVNGASSTADIARFDSVLQAERAKQADRYLAQEVVSALQSRFHLHGVSVTVTGDADAGSLQVTVLLGTPVSDVSQIARYVADTLSISSGRVHIGTHPAGGMDSGF